MATSSIYFEIRIELVIKTMIEINNEKVNISKIPKPTQCFPKEISLLTKELLSKPLVFIFSTMKNMPIFLFIFVYISKEMGIKLKKYFFVD